MFTATEFAQQLMCGVIPWERQLSNIFHVKTFSLWIMGMNILLVQLILVKAMRWTRSLHLRTLLMNLHICKFETKLRA